MRTKGSYWAGILMAVMLPGDTLLDPTPLQTAALVTGLPAGFDAKAPRQPYRGPHPSRLERPAETFRFPIRLGEVGPAEALFAGPRQYPFICDTAASGLGPPLADNTAGVGTPAATDANPQGFSADCLAPTQARYYYKPRASTTFRPWDTSATDVDEAVVNGRSVPFVVRVETGTINRFIYVLAALKDADETLAAPGAGRWNRRLIYQFFGGVGVGHRQGKGDVQKVLGDRVAQLAKGYAVVASTGNATTNHYNIWLNEDTALRVKRQFIALYGEPEYTVGVGGSGGGIQQYLLAQNHPGLIDAGLAQLSYPDMVTQTIPIFDCELLEHYFDVTDVANPLWRQAKNRQLIEGLNADNAAQNIGKAKKIADIIKLSYLARGELPPELEGQTECVAGWRGLTPLVLNPRFAALADRVSDTVYQQVLWSYFEDLKDFYGTDASGFARVPWDNVGVQYGLAALKGGQISAAQFLALNARVGSWKPAAQMLPERFWIIPGALSALTDFSPWGAHNMALGTPAQPAPRAEGDRQAMAAAYRSGQVFLGHLDIPVIDLRFYLDPGLDMHHAAASFSTRARLLAGQRHADNQAIWISDKRHDPTPAAFAAIDAWLRARRAQPGAPWSAVRPEVTSDRCLDASGAVLSSGPGVWDGDWNGRPAGACMRTYPIFSNSRMVAGDSIHGDRFKCALQSVGHAIAHGVYAPVDMGPHRAELERIFPQGVCDYTQPDLGRPDDLDHGPGPRRAR